MAPYPAKLTIVPYLQAWNPASAELQLNVAVIPIDDPRRPLSDGWAGSPVPAAPAFRDAKVRLEVHLSNDPGRVPNRTDVPGSGTEFSLTMPAGQASVFDELAARFDLSLPHQAVTQTAAMTLHKYLPKSYRSASGFVAPKTPLAVLDDSYHCALHCPPDPIPPRTPKPEKKLSWGEAYAMLLRQPPVAREAGLIHSIKLPVGDTFAGGGWIFFSLAAAGDFRSQFDADPDFARYFATRVPALDPAATRPVFTPVLFPVAADAAGTAALGSFDTVFGEARRLDDGFAKIVHARQPLKNDLSDDNDETPDLPPNTDMGIQLAWDDEDVVEGQNRAIGLYPDGSAPAPAPSGASGYRIDVRETGVLGWHSLCRIAAPSFRLGAISLPPFESELNVEVHPSKLAGRFWLPAYFARWQGSSIVADTPDRRLLLNRFDDRPDLYEPLAAHTVPLRYGRHYEFRIRLADATGGGPHWTEEPVNTAEAPVASLHFRRTIPPAEVGIEADPPATGQPPTNYRVHRPGLGFPAAEFADIPNAEARLAAIVRGNMAAPGNPPQLAVLPDPDAEFLEIIIDVRAPRFDPLGGATGWQRLYSTFRRFPPIAADGIAPPYELLLEWADCARLSDFAWEVPTQPAGSVTGAVQAPRARDVRITLRAVGRNDLTYWMSDAARHGRTMPLVDPHLHIAATAESPIFSSNDPAAATLAVILQPEPARATPTRSAVTQIGPSSVLTKRLASALGLMEEDGTLFAPPGERIVFGCHGLKHHLPPDNSSLALTTMAELPLQWISAVRLTLDRDWTWLGQGAPAFRLKRMIRLVPEGSSRILSLGSVMMHHTVNRQALRGEPDRERAELVFLDAFEPPIKIGLPYEVELSYEVDALFEDGTSEKIALSNHLPIVTPPRQLPKIASVGHAFSAYVIGEDYASTEVRQQMLWVEFEEPPTDSRDIYFARVLTSAPDPLMLSRSEPVADPPGYEAPALDPETVRVIRPGQADDFAGFSALQPLIPADEEDPARKGRFYLVPLPPNMASNSDELFGFFTYEFRVGHNRGSPSVPFWSTAQGRFGQPMVIEGVHHPAPALDCKVYRDKADIVATATFARPVHEGRDLSPSRPHTDIWVALYGRVMQADGATMRNLQLDARRALRPRRARRSAAPAIGRIEWKLDEVGAMLDRWGLPRHTPLSALAIELLPEPNARFADPLGGDLSQVRILRTSPLVEIEGDCCN